MNSKDNEKYGFNHPHDHGPRPLPATMAAGASNTRFSSLRASQTMVAGLEDHQEYRRLRS